MSDQLGNGSSVLKGEFAWIAPGAGMWTVAPANFDGAQLAYTLVATVQRFTQTNVAAPTLVKHARQFKVGGSVSGSAGLPANSKVALTVKGAGLSKPLSRGLPVAISGRFTTHDSDLVWVLLKRRWL